MSSKGGSSSVGSAYWSIQGVDNEVSNLLTDKGYDLEQLSYDDSRVSELEEQRIDALRNFDQAYTDFQNAIETNDMTYAEEAIDSFQSGQHNYQQFLNGLTGSFASHMDTNGDEISEFWDFYEEVEKSVNEAVRTLDLIQQSRKK